MRQATHSEPVWRDRANFIIVSRIDPGGTDVRTEQLWARKLSERRFQLCCIPFFVYNLALGDVVETDEEYLLQRVTARSGHYTFRVAFKPPPDVREEVVDQLQALDALLEWSSASLLAVDAADYKHAQRVADFLWKREQHGELTYETGRAV